MSPSFAVVLLLVICHVDRSYQSEINDYDWPTGDILNLSPRETTESPEELTTMQPEVPIEEEKCTAEYSCSGCYNILICKSTDSGYKKVMTLTCKEPTPYCDDVTTTCVSSAPSPCVPSDNFTCMQDGLFPDPVNCSKYHFCKHPLAIPYSCPKGKHFDANSNECTSSQCHTFNCIGKHGLKSYHSGNPNIFAYCSDSVPVTISRCRESYELNETTQKCEFVCRREGHYVDVEDDKKYYKCDSRNVLAHSQCSISYKFDPVHLRCVPSYMLERFRYGY